MSLLLDTPLPLWASAAEERLPRAARELIGDGADTLFSSVVSLFEVVLRARKLRKELGIEPHEYREGWLGAGHREVAVPGEQVIAIARLPLPHKDPFDRLLGAGGGGGAGAGDGGPGAGAPCRAGPLRRLNPTPPRPQRGGMRSTWPG